MVFFFIIPLAFRKGSKDNGNSNTAVYWFAHGPDGGRRVQLRWSVIVSLHRPEPYSSDGFLCACTCCAGASGAPPKVRLPWLRVHTRATGSGGQARLRWRKHVQLILVPNCFSIYVSPLGGPVASGVRGLRVLRRGRAWRRLPWHVPRPLPLPLSRRLQRRQRNASLPRSVELKQKRNQTANERDARSVLMERGRNEVDERRRREMSWPTSGQAATAATRSLAGGDVRTTSGRLHLTQRRGVDGDGGAPAGALCAASGASAPYSTFPPPPLLFPLPLLRRPPPTRNPCAPHRV